MANYILVGVSHYWKPVLIGFAGVISSLWLLFSELSYARAAQMNALREESRAAIALINLKIKTSEQYLFSLKGFFATNGKINKSDFHDYIYASDVLSRLNYLDNFNYALTVDANKMDCLTHLVRFDRSMGDVGQEFFKIKNMERSAIAHPIVFVEPWLNGEGAAYGFGKSVLLGANKKSNHEFVRYGHFFNPDRPGVLYVGIRLFTRFSEPKTYDCGMSFEYGSFGAAIDMPKLIMKCIDSKRLRVEMFGVELPPKKPSIDMVRLFASTRDEEKHDGPVYKESVVLGQMRYLFAFERMNNVDPIKTARPWQVFFFGLLVTILATWIAVVLASLARTNKEKAHMALAEANAYRDHLARLDRLNLLANLTAGVTHEIQQPLASARLWLDGIFLKISAIKDLSFENKSTLQNQIESVVGELERASNIVVRLRNVASRKTEQIESTRFEVGEAIAQCVDTLSHSYQLAGVELKYTQPGFKLFTRVDRVLFVQTLLNLLSNALDASKEGDSDSVSVSLAINSDRSFSVCVEDNGPGIQVEPVTRVFDPLFSTKPHGSGIGLFICRIFAEHHNGWINVRNKPEGGACFELCLPQLAD
jgi:signal transduction histidine kinase